MDVNNTSWDCCEECLGASRCFCLAGSDITHATRTSYRRFCPLGTVGVAKGWLRESFWVESHRQRTATMSDPPSLAKVAEGDHAEAVVLEDTAGEDGDDAGGGHRDETQHTSDHTSKAPTPSVANFRRVRQLGSGAFGTATLYQRIEVCFVAFVVSFHIGVWKSEVWKSAAICCHTTTGTSARTSLPLFQFRHTTSEEYYQTRVNHTTQHSNKYGRMHVLPMRDIQFSFCLLRTCWLIPTRVFAAHGGRRITPLWSSRR